LPNLWSRSISKYREAGTRSSQNKITRKNKPNFIHLRR
jgi:hypothetical protein